MGIDRIQMRLADKGGHQHQQGRFWQVEIGHKPIRDLKLKPRINENVRIALERAKGATARSRLNQTQRSRADGNNPAARRPRFALSQPRPADSHGPIRHAFYGG